MTDFAMIYLQAVATEENTMAAKIASDAKQDSSGNSVNKVNISEVHISAVKVAKAEPVTEPNALPAKADRRAAALQTLRENRHLFTAEAVIDRAARLKTL